jgi:aminopeptidase B
MAVTTVDPATCASLHEVRMHHLQLHLDVDMVTRRIAAEATLSMKRLNGYSGRHVQLDVFHLQIHDVAVLVDADVVATHENEEEEDLPVSIAGGLARLPVAKWEIKPFTSFGEILSMELPAELDAVEAFQLHIRYETEQESPAVCWLDKEQTAGKHHAFMYTQGQEVLNRSFFPCQDSPSVRITYEAGVVVPSELVCVMSAELLGSGSVDASSLVQKTAFQFEMKQSIPVYLVAMAVGDLVSADVGPRSSVWTEPCMLEACKNEFTGILENYLAIGERLFGEYLWERYDLLVMPPSFPYGGMENPRLTFVSPCIIAGDQSLCSSESYTLHSHRRALMLTEYVDSRRS